MAESAIEMLFTETSPRQPLERSDEDKVCTPRSNFYSTETVVCSVGHLLGTAHLHKISSLTEIWVVIHAHFWSDIVLVSEEISYQYFDWISNCWVQQHQEKWTRRQSAPFITVVNGTRTQQFLNESSILWSHVFCNVYRRLLQSQRGIVIQCLWRHAFQKGKGKRTRDCWACAPYLRGGFSCMLFSFIGLCFEMKKEAEGLFHTHSLRRSAKIFFLRL